MPGEDQAGEGKHRLDGDLLGVLGAGEVDRAVRPGARHVDQLVGGGLRDEDFRVGFEVDDLGPGIFGEVRDLDRRLRGRAVVPRAALKTRDEEIGGGVVARRVRGDGLIVALDGQPGEFAEVPNGTWRRRRCRRCASIAPAAVRPHDEVAAAGEDVAGGVDGDVDDVIVAAKGGRTMPASPNVPSSDPSDSSRATTAPKSSPAATMRPCASRATELKPPPLGDCARRAHHDAAVAESVVQRPIGVVAQQQGPARATWESN